MRALPAGSSANVVPKMVLSRSGKMSYDSAFEDQTTRILETCKDVEERLASLISELSHTVDARLSSNLQ